MHKPFWKLNEKQIFILLIGGPFFLLLLRGLLYGIMKIPVPTLIVSPVCIFIISRIVRLYWIATDSSDDTILLCDTAKWSSDNGASPFCGSKDKQLYSLQVGYRKPHVWFMYYFVLIKWRLLYTSLSIDLPICETCRMKYLRACRMKLFSSVTFKTQKVLKRKVGYLRGLDFPYLTGRLKPITAELRNEDIVTPRAD